MNQNLIAIAATHCKGSDDGIGTLDERFEKVCKSAHEFWLTTDQEVRLQGAIVAFGSSLKYRGEDDAFEKLRRSVDASKALAAMLSGVPVDVESIDTDDIIPLSGIFRKAGA